MQITDFGVSGKIENTIGKAASFVGTVTYMSPERINGNRHSTVADIWSLGLTVLEVRCGFVLVHALTTRTVRTRLLSLLLPREQGCHGLLSAP